MASVLGTRFRAEGSRAATRPPGRPRRWPGGCGAWRRCGSPRWWPATRPPSAASARHHPGGHLQQPDAADADPAPRAGRPLHRGDLPAPAGPVRRHPRLPLRADPAGRQAAGLVPAAADAARDAFANQTAIATYQRLLPLLEGPASGHVLLELGAVWQLVGRWDDAQKAYLGPCASLGPATTARCWPLVAGAGRPVHLHQVVRRGGPVAHPGRRDLRGPRRPARAVPGPGPAGLRPDPAGRLPAGGRGVPAAPAAGDRGRRPGGHERRPRPPWAGQRLHRRPGQGPTCSGARSRWPPRPATAAPSSMPPTTCAAVRQPGRAPPGAGLHQHRPAGGHRDRLPADGRGGHREPG